ncbi:hypothetical protein OC845_005977 [Tilletia horrida]|nr:hypothetical protein OC845_005977 [Tilletia horrida]
MAEPLVLWALHDFEAEQPDEVSFKAGEQITVIEKDDEFSDGWYTGRNESGAQGLFPFAYTTTDKSLALQSKQASSHLHTGAEQQQQQTSFSHQQPASQRRSSIDTDTYSLAETDAADNKKSTSGGTPGEYVPPSGGRAALAASAQRNAAQESASEREAEARRKQLAQQQFEQEEQRQRALIEAAALTNAAKNANQRKQQDAALASNSLTSLAGSSQRAAAGVKKSGSNSGLPRTAPVAGMNVSYESDDSEAEDENGFDISQLKHIHAPILGGGASPAMGATPRLNGNHAAGSTSANLQAAAGAGNGPSASATPNPALTPTLASSATADSGAKLSSPAPINTGPASRVTPLRTQSHASEQADSVGNLPSATSSSNKQAGSAANTPTSSDPHEWSVDEVVEWGRSKGWDDATVLSKFREHEISGDVLMEMDVVILKEIDIVAYGKRLKVANAIKELKRNLRGGDGGHDSGAMTPQTPGGGVPGTFSGQRTPANVQITPRHTSLGLPPEETSEQLESPVFPPGHNQQQHPPLSANSTSSAGIFAQMQQQQPGGPGFTGIGSGNALGTGVTGSRASIVSAHSGNGVLGGGGRPYSHSRNESADGRPRSAGGLSLTGSFGGGNSGAAGQGGWPRSGPLELGFGGPHARAVTDQGGSTNGSVRNMLMLDGTTANNSTDGDSTLRSRDDGTAAGGNSTGSSGGGFLSTLGRGSGTKEGKASSRLSKNSDGTASPTSPNLRVGRNVGVGERSSFFGLGPRTRKPAPKELGEGGGKSTLSRLGIGKNSDKANAAKDRTGSLADLKERISLPTSSPNYEANSSSMNRAGSGIGISGAGLGSNGESPLLDSAPPQLSLGSEIDGGQTELLSSTGGDDDKAHPTSTRPSGHMKKASVDSTTGAGPEWNGIGTGPMSPLSPGATAGEGSGGVITSGPVMARIRPVDFEGWIKKKTERYGTWKPRYMALKGPDLVLLRDPTAEKIKGYVSMKGYKVIADENTNPGKYGFKILHEHEKPHYFSSDDPILVREWMKALMKSTIGRDHSFPVISSYNNPTISLKEAQRMNPPPRPPSPTSRARVQRANARTNTQTLSAKDASVLMGLSSPSLPGRM